MDIRLKLFNLRSLIRNHIFSARACKVPSALKVTFSICFPFIRVAKIPSQNQNLTKQNSSHKTTFTMEALLRHPNIMPAPSQSISGPEVYWILTLLAGAYYSHPMRSNSTAPRKKSPGHWRSGLHIAYLSPFTAITDALLLLWEVQREGSGSLDALSRVLERRMQKGSQTEDITFEPGFSEKKIETNDSPANGLPTKVAQDIRTRLVITTVIIFQSLRILECDEGSISLLWFGMLFASWAILETAFFTSSLLRFTQKQMQPTAPKPVNATSHQSRIYTLLSIMVIHFIVSVASIFQTLQNPLQKPSLFSSTRQTSSTSTAILQSISTIFFNPVPKLSLQAIKWSRIYHPAGDTSSNMISLGSISTPVTSSAAIDSTFNPSNFSTATTSSLDWLYAHIGATLLMTFLLIQAAKFVKADWVKAIATLLSIPFATLCAFVLVLHCLVVVETVARLIPGFLLVVGMTLAWDKVGVNAQARAVVWNVLLGALFVGYPSLYYCVLY